MARQGGQTSLVASVFETLTPVQGAITVNGQTESDTLTIDDRGSITPHVYTQTATSFKRDDTATFTFSGIQTLKVFKGRVVGDCPASPGTLAGQVDQARPARHAERCLVDADKGQNLSLTVDWGDDSPPQVTHPGRKPFSLRHHYAAAGTYTVRVIWTDSTGQSNSQDLHLSVIPRLAKPGLAHIAKAHFAHSGFRVATGSRH